MKLLASKVLFLALSALVAMPASSSEEADLRMAGIVRLSPAFGDYWFGYVEKLHYARQYMLMASVVDSCPEIANAEPNFFLVPKLRKAAEQSIKPENNPVQKLLGSGYQRYEMRYVLFALSKLTPAERADLEVFGKDAELLQFEGEVGALGGFLRLNPVNGELEAESVIWLKTYFEREGHAEKLRKAVAEVAPKLLKRFDSVKSIEQHGPEDAKWLTKFSKDLLDPSERIQNAYIRQASKALVARSVAFEAHAFFARLNRVTQAREAKRVSEQSFPSKTKLSNEDAAILAEVDSKFSPPASVNDRINKLSPIDYAGAPFRKICPEVR